MTVATRTFDCPWCGAINPVPADHLGEHFACPECKKATKLTVHNTTSKAPTAPPEGAPMTSGHRTFDCPWCGAISDVPASHLGEYYRCPECNKETKLTPANMRAASLTAPPPDAPPVRSGAGPKVLAAAVVLLLLGAGAWFALGSKGDGDGKGDGGGNEPAPVAYVNTTVEQQPPSPTDVPATPHAPHDPPVPPSTAPTLPPAPTPPFTPDGPTPTVPSDVPTPSVPTPPPAGAELLAAQQRHLEATAALARATQAHQAAVTAVEAWTAQNGAATAGARDTAVLDDLRAEWDKRASAGDAPLSTPEAARAADAALSQFVGADPERVRVAERVVVWLRADLFGREAAGATDWRALHLSSPGVRRAIDALRATASTTAAVVPAELLRAEESARAEREAAQRRVAETDADVARLSPAR